ncbi:Receptor-interacting serine/threonine-protein kinase 1 [Linnemannia hyalina]|uniref:Receptor-interacting serine/threonine-protein kinase 1 n=1 Tax=Linnemannia hyalina TaxID=64524 RepID=A0A9P7XT28_9FUNG|nr:Receptor-interacting serine/threonine-protein kinase 1 [Linnemannia hyalina]
MSLAKIPSIIPSSSRTLDIPPSQPSPGEGQDSTQVPLSHSPLNLTDIQQDGLLGSQPQRGSQQAIIEAINNRRRAERSQQMMAKGSLAHNPLTVVRTSQYPSSVSSRSTSAGNWTYMTPHLLSPNTSPSLLLRLPYQGNQRAVGSRTYTHTFEIPTSRPSADAIDAVGSRLHIPRDLESLPDAFRRRGVIRSHPPSIVPVGSEGTRAGPTSLKRTHSSMLQEDLQGSVPTLHPEDQSRKMARRVDLGSLPQHLAQAKNLAIRSTKGTLSTASSPSLNNGSQSTLSSASLSTPSSTISTADHSPANPAITSLQRQRTKSKSKSSSPTSTPVRFPSPGQGSSESVAPSKASAKQDSSRNASASASHGHVTRSNEGIPANGTNTTATTTASNGNAGTGLEATSPPPATLTTSGTTGQSDPEVDLEPIDLTRVGVGILDNLVSHTFSKSFITKVPQSIANYHVLIKKPMDLWTIEQRLWKTLETSGAKSGAPPSTSILLAASGAMSMSVTEAYNSLADFERDLRRIVQNAMFFNSATHTIYKEAQEFQNSYLGQLDNFRKGVLEFGPLPHESYKPELLSMTLPGPLYLFRAHTPREMDRKMTDISTDLFSSLHQPIFDIATDQIGQLSPERPRFVRMFINKNRSLLAKCGDERFARVAILTDIQVSKPYMGSFGDGSESSKAVSSPGPGRPKSSGAQGGPTSMVKMTAKVLIGKPIGERHDMVTVGDLDCPNAWMTVACVRAMEVEVEVPARFEKGVLSKMRHEVVPYSSDPKNTPEHQRVFASALNILLPGIAKTFQNQGQTPALIDTPQSILSSPSSSASTPPATKGLGLGITTPSTTISEATSTSPRKRGASSTVATITAGAASSKSTWVDIQDGGPKGRYLVKLRLPAVIRTTRRRGMSSAGISMDSQHVGSASTPSTPLIPGRVHALSSQVPAAPSHLSDKESLSAPDWMLLNEQVTKRGSKMLQDLKAVARQKKVPYARWNTIEPTLTVDSAHGLFKRIYHVRGQPGLVVQNFKEMDAESFDQRVREVACLLKLRGFQGVGQIQSVIDNEDDHLVGLSMTKYAYTLKQYATNARRHPTPCQKLSLIREMVSAMCAIHRAGLAHRDLSEVNIMVDEDPHELLEDQSPRPLIKVIDFGKSVFVNPAEVQRWSMRDHVPKEELALLPLVVLPPDHGYKLYRSILTLPKTKHDHTPLAPVDPRSEDVYSLGVLIWRTFSGKSPWNGAIEDDLKTIRYLVSSDSQIRFQLEKEVAGTMSRELLLRCLTARAETRSTTQQLKDWLNQPEVASGLLQEFEALGGGRKKVRKNLD